MHSPCTPSCRCQQPVQQVTSAETKKTLQFMEGWRLRAQSCADVRTGNSTEPAQMQKYIQAQLDLQTEPRCAPFSQGNQLQLPALQVSRHLTPKSRPCYQQWKVCNPNPESVMSGFAWGETNPTSLLHSSAAAISHIFGLTAKCTCKNIRLKRFYNSFTLKSLSIR